MTIAKGPPTQSVEVLKKVDEVPGVKSLSNQRGQATDELGGQLEEIAAYG